MACDYSRCRVGISDVFCKPGVVLPAVLSAEVDELHRDVEVGRLQHGHDGLQVIPAL